MKRTLQMVCLCLGILYTFWSFSSVYAAPLQVHKLTTIPQTVYTIEWFDTSGQISKVWQGNLANYEKIRQQEEAVRKPLLKEKTQHLQAITPDINRVNGCALPNSYFDLYNEGLVCFANNGAQLVGIHSVYEITSGNNSGVFGWGFLCPGSDTDICTWGNITFKDNSAYFPPQGTLWYIWNIDISGR